MDKIFVRPPGLKEWTEVFGYTWAEAKGELGVHSFLKLETPTKTIVHAPSSRGFDSHK